MTGVETLGRTLEAHKIEEVASLPADQHLYGLLRTSPSLPLPCVPALRSNLLSMSFLQLDQNEKFGSGHALQDQQLQRSLRQERCPKERSEEPERVAADAVDVLVVVVGLASILDLEPPLICGGVLCDRVRRKGHIRDDARAFAGAQLECDHKWCRPRIGGVDDYAALLLESIEHEVQDRLSSSTG